MKLKTIVAGCLIGWCSLSYADKELDKILNPPDDELSKLLKSLKSYFAPVSEKEPDKCKNTSSKTECNKPPSSPPGMSMMIADKKDEPVTIGKLGGAVDALEKIENDSTDNTDISEREDKVDIADTSDNKSEKKDRIDIAMIEVLVNALPPNIKNRHYRPHAAPPHIMKNRLKNNKPRYTTSTAITSDSTKDNDKSLGSTHYFLLGKDLAELYPTDVNKLKEACEWFKKAADAGNTEGKKAVDSKVCKELFK